MIKPTPLTRPRWCPRCGTRMRVSRNPYYGVGLAVHQHLSGCPRCGFVQFLPGERRSEQPAAVAEPPRPSTTGWAHRALALATRLFTAPR